MNQAASHPIASAMPVKELPGLLFKSFDVSAGRQGLAILSSGKFRLLPIGRHIVWSWLPRLDSQEDADWVGSFPDQPFTLTNDYPHLLSGDGEEVDASIFFLTSIKNPLQFFQSVLIPSREIPAEGFRLQLPGLESLLTQLVRRYTAADLCAGLPSEFVMGEISDILTQRLAEMGLEMNSIRVLSFLPTASPRTAHPQSPAAPLNIFELLKTIAKICLWMSPIVLILDPVIGIPLLPDATIYWLLFWGVIFLTANYLLRHSVRGSEQKTGYQASSAR